MRQLWDIRRGKATFSRKSCEIVRWEGKGMNCYVRDPFGMVFNVWEEN